MLCFFLLQSREREREREREIQYNTTTTFYKRRECFRCLMQQTFSGIGEDSTEKITHYTLFFSLIFLSRNGFYLQHGFGFIWRKRMQILYGTRKRTPTETHTHSRATRTRKFGQVVINNNNNTYPKGNKIHCFFLYVVDGFFFFL